MTLSQSHYHIFIIIIITVNQFVNTTLVALYHYEEMLNTRYLTVLYMKSWYPGRSVNAPPRYQI